MNHWFPIGLSPASRPEADSMASWLEWSLRGRLHDPVARGTQDEPQVPILNPFSGLTITRFHFETHSLESPSFLVAKEMPQGCLQRTLFEVAISFCSSLDEVITGTLQKGS